MQGIYSLRGCAADEGLAALRSFFGRDGGPTSICIPLLHNLYVLQACGGALAGTIMGFPPCPPGRSTTLASPPHAIFFYGVQGIYSLRGCAADEGPAAPPKVGRSAPAASNEFDALHNGAAFVRRTCLRADTHRQRRTPTLGIVAGTGGFPSKIPR